MITEPKTYIIPKPIDWDLYEDFEQEAFIGWQKALTKEKVHHWDKSSIPGYFAGWEARGFKKCLKIQDVTDYDGGVIAEKIIGEIDAEECRRCGGDVAPQIGTICTTCTTVYGVPSCDSCGKYTLEEDSLCSQSCRDKMREFLERS